MFRKLFLLLLALFSNYTFSQTFSLYQQFEGKYDFLMFGNTLNPNHNGLFANCAILTQSQATLSLQPGQNVVAAYLFGQDREVCNKLI